MDDGNGAHVPGAFMPEWRRVAQEHGVTVTLEDIYDFQGNPSGGRTQMGTVFGRSTGILKLDLDKLGHLHGSSIYASGVFQTGSNLAKTYIGAWDITSSIAGTHTFRFHEYYWQQAFAGNKVTVRTGQIAGGPEFGNQAIGFDDKSASFKTWVNTSMANGLPTVRQVYLALPPTGKPAVLLLLEPNKHVFIKVAALSGSHSPYDGDDSGIRFDLRNAPVAALSLG